MLDPPKAVRGRDAVLHVLGLLLTLIGIALVGLVYATEENLRRAWLLVLVLMAFFAVLAGHGVTGYWRGILISPRYKISLSHLQLLSWTLVILSALLTAALTNISVFGLDSALEIHMPAALLILMGISTASFVGSPAVLSTKRARRPRDTERTETTEALERQGYREVDVPANDLLVRNKTPGVARWSDLLKGEEVGNAATLDLGKMQMFFFTFVLLIAYASLIAAAFSNGGPFEGFPEIDDGMNTLLGISHTGYLANKAIPHTPEA